MEKEARRIVAALAGIESGPMLDGQAVRMLMLLTAESAAAAVASLLAVAAPPPRVRHALSALCRVLLPGSQLPPERRAAIHRAAASHHHPALVALLSNPAPAMPPVGATVRPARPPDDETLGHRTQRARVARSRDDIARLTRDDVPAVIRNLLLNPRLTEPAVVSIAARRPVPKEVLEEVARSTRWIARASVRRALVANPFTPTARANALLPELLASELREILADPVVHPAVRLGARALLAARALPEQVAQAND